MPSDSLSIEMLPADHGDCLLVAYGDMQAPRRVLIDGGTTATFSRLRKLIEALPLEQRHFELLIVTHIDSDHIDGVLPLLREREKLGVSFNDIWFNGWRHLVRTKSEFMGPRQGDMLGNFLSMHPELPWNKKFSGATVVVPDGGALPTHELNGGLKLTLLSPTRKELDALETTWIEASFRQGRIPGEAPPILGHQPSRLRQIANNPFIRDHAAANGSSIAVLLEYQGKRCLLTGDAFADTLLASINRLPDTQGRLKVDAFKLPHHASKANVKDALIQAVQCSRYLISTDGGRFNHPDDEAIVRVLSNADDTVELYFNYESSTTRKWKLSKLPSDMHVKQYRAYYPSSEEGGLRIELLSGA